MTKSRDRCWLKKKVEQSGIMTYQIQNRSGSVIISTIERELPLLFQGITASETLEASLELSLDTNVQTGEEGYKIEKNGDGYCIKGVTEQGLLYGLFGLHRMLQSGKEQKFPASSAPDQEIRMINHWDNFDGSIERGYAGNSIYYDNCEFRGDFELLRQYARLMASVGLNAVTINNVNVHEKETFFVEKENLIEIRKIADVFGEYGIRMFLSINFAAPMEVGGLSTADPLDLEVADWWKQTAAGIYEMIPDFAGFLVKADSEGRPGPFTYGRNHDAGANMLARAVKPFGGLVIWRCFVYNCGQEWHNRNIDRARAAFDIFKELDGQFDENVILQIKNGPIDFQIREPVSPLFGALQKTNQILEFQITQEYTGHQKDICYLVPIWKEVLEFNTGHGKDGLTSEDGKVRYVLREYSPVKRYSGIAAVGGAGMDSNWMGNKLAQINLYGYGRLIWDNGLSSEEIAEEWTTLTFELPEEEKKKLIHILITSRNTYEDYTCPLSVGFMCTRKSHYGVEIDGYEYDKWGTYHYADRNGVGRDRTRATGTGYVDQYSKLHSDEYEKLDTCPDELLLFFHHVPYTHKLHSGKTVIQHIYDTHFDGVEKVKRYQAAWRELKAVLDTESYENVKERLELQLTNAIDWRDQVNTYFYRKSGIADERGREIYL